MIIVGVRCVTIYDRSNIQAPTVIRDRTGTALVVSLAPALSALRRAVMHAAEAWQGNLEGQLELCSNSLTRDALRISPEVSRATSRPRH